MVSSHADTLPTIPVGSVSEGTIRDGNNQALVLNFYLHKLAALTYAYVHKSDHGRLMPTKAKALRRWRGVLDSAVIKGVAKRLS